MTQRQVVEMPQWVRDIDRRMVLVERRRRGGGGGAAGVTDHGALSGLGDDDHPQYLTQARGDSLFLKPGDVLPGTNVTVDTTTTPGSIIISSSGGFERQMTSFTTGSLAPGASELATVPLATGYLLLLMAVSRPARVRLYTTAAKRDADLDRPIGTDPGGDHGLMVEFVMAAGLLRYDLSPTVDGFDGKATPDGVIPYSVTNMDSAAGTVKVDIVWIRTE